MMIPIVRSIARLSEALVCGDRGVWYPTVGKDIRAGWVRGFISFLNMDSHHGRSFRAHGATREAARTAEQEFVAGCILLGET